MIFEKQVKGWFLEPASACLKEEDNGFIVLITATAYIEGIEQYRQGKSSNGRSKDFFKCGMIRIFNLNSCLRNRLDDLYSELRCGLFHNGMTGPNIRIHSSYDGPIAFSDNGLIEISQKLFLESVKHDFEQYLKALKGNVNELKDNFNKMYTFE